MINNLKSTLTKINIVILLLLSQTILNAQENVVNDSSNIEVNLRSPIPLNKSDNKFYSLEDETASIIIDVSDQLFLDEIIVCIQLDTIAIKLDNQEKYEIIKNLVKIKQYDEAIVIDQVIVDYEEILLEDHQNYFKKSNNITSENILSTLTFFSYLLNTKTGENLGSFDFELQEVAKNKEKSRLKVLNSFRKRIRTELKRFYWFSADVDSIKGENIIIPLGSKYGIKKGQIFEIVEPEREWTTDEEEWISQPKTVGFVSVIDTSKEGSTVKVLRKWDNFYEGSWVVEHFNPIFALELNCIPPVSNRYFNLGLLFHAKPLQKYDFGGGIQFIRVADSYGDDNYGFGFTGFGTWRFLNKPRLNFGGTTGANLDIPFKRDNYGTTVLTSLFSFNLGFLTEIAINKSIDFVINTGYRYAIDSDAWTYSEDDESYPAVWENDAPKVDNSGFMISFGFKYFLF